MTDLQALTAAQYRSALRAAVRGYATRVHDYDQFFGNMTVAIESNFRRAWYAGAKECGIAPAELSPEEKATLASAIVRERGFVDRLASYIEDNRTEDGTYPNDVRGKFQSRMERWVNRYNTLQNQAMQIACADQKLMWVLGIAEHCPSCLKLAGKIKRASYWKREDVRPQHPYKLECMISAGGVDVCQCRFEQTDLLLSPGPLPRLP